PSCASEKLVLKTGFPRRGRAMACSADHNSIAAAGENLPGNPVFTGGRGNPVSEGHPGQHVFQVARTNRARHVPEETGFLSTKSCDAPSPPSGAVVDDCAIG